MVVVPVDLNFVDLLFTVVAFGFPPLLMICVVNKRRAFIWSALVFWFVLIVSGQYHLAFTPGYDSIAPGLSIVAGWIPATAYAAFCLCAVLVLDYVGGNSRRIDLSKEKPQDSNERD